MLAKEAGYSLLGAIARERSPEHTGRGNNGRGDDSIAMGRVRMNITIFGRTAIGQQRIPFNTHTTRVRKTVSARAGESLIYGGEITTNAKRSIWSFNPRRDHGLSEVLQGPGAMLSGEPLTHFSKIPQMGGPLNSAQYTNIKSLEGAESV